MASPSERRRQKSIAKQKQRRESAQVSRRRRTAKASGPRGDASGWPVHEAWISEDWYEWEAKISGMITRKHADGTLAYAVFDVDLADEGLTACKTESGLAEGNVIQAIVDRSQTKAMMLTAPANIARLVQDALDWRRRRTLPDPKGLAEALEYLDDVDAEDARSDFLFGREDEEEATSEIPGKQGLWDKVRSLFS